MTDFKDETGSPENSIDDGLVERVRGVRNALSIHGRLEVEERDLTGHVKQRWLHTESQTPILVGLRNV